MSRRKFRKQKLDTNALEERETADWVSDLKKKKRVTDGPSPEVKKLIEKKKLKK